MSNLTAQQKLAVTSTSTRLVLACSPGSGKSHTLVSRIRHLIENCGTSPKAIIAITYTNNAADVLKQRLEGVELGYVGTLHSFLFRFIQSYGHLIGYQNPLTILDEKSYIRIIEDLITQSSYRGSKENLLNKIKNPSKFNERLTKDDILIAQFFSTLKSGGMLTFDSILTLGLELINSLPLNSLAISGHKLTHMLVDEIQDASDLDWSIYHALGIENKFYVGDSDQSIFAWRGGNVEHFVDVSENPHYQKIVLEENFRSAQEICDCAQKLIEHNPKRIPKKMVSKVDFKGEVLIRGAFDSALSESQSIAVEIAKGEIDHAEIAVLVRTNALVEEYTNFLTGFGIPVSRKEQIKLPADWDKCRLLISLLENPSNDFLAKAWIEADEGHSKAKSVQTAAAKNYRSINKEYLKFDAVEVGDIPSFLRLKGISFESSELVQKNMEGAEDIPGLMINISKAIFDEEVGSGVRVSTFHSAKGLEFDTVFLPAFEQDIIPGTRKNTNLPEERRVAFVAITRAKRRVIFSTCKQRNLPWNNQPKPSIPSIFLRESVL